MLISPAFSFVASSNARLWLAVRKRDGRTIINKNKTLKLFFLLSIINLNQVTAAVSDDKKSMSSKIGGILFPNNCLFQTSHTKWHLLSKHYSVIWWTLKASALIHREMSGWLESYVQLALYWCDFKMLNWACLIDANVNLSLSHT